MTRKEFIELVENGRDILFDMNNVSYAIFTWDDEGYAIWNKSTRKKKTYNTVEELVDDYPVDISNVKITEYS